MVFLIEHTYAKMNSLNELSIDIFHNACKNWNEKVLLCLQILIDEKLMNVEHCALGVAAGILSSFFNFYILKNIATMNNLIELVQPPELERCIVQVDKHTFFYYLFEE